MSYSLVTQEQESQQLAKSSLVGDVLLAPYQQAEKGCYNNEKT